MKARIKATDKVITLNEKVSLTDYARGIYRDTDGNRYHYKELEFMEEKVENKIDWEQRRYEIAREMLLTTSNFTELSCNGITQYRICIIEAVKIAVKYADYLIAELKEGGEK